ncbi:MAG: AzlC family ABC transporter permease [Pseudomonadota bacterium]
MARYLDGTGFRAGVIASIPALLAVAPFGLIYGVLAAEAGLDPLQAMAMTTVVIAGASQFAALQLMSDGAPALIAVLTGAVVNLRMAMYSASIAAEWRGAPLWVRALAAYTLHDQAFAIATRRYQERPDEPLERKTAFYFGVGLTTCLVWVIASAAGLALGAQAPEAWSLDFAVPATFLAIVAPMLRTLAHVAAAASAALAAALLVALPLQLGLIVAALIGVAVGAAVEIGTTRWAARRDRAAGVDAMEGRG